MRLLILATIASLGHLEMVDTDMAVPEEDEQLNYDGEGRKDNALYNFEKEAITNARVSSMTNIEC